MPPKASALKKIVHASEQERPDVAAARAAWIAAQPGLDPSRLVFIDETGTSTNMARLRGRARRGRRVVGRVPWGHWKIVTFVAALRQDAITAPFVIDRAMTSVIFIEYVRHCLVPTLSPGDLVVMDNLQPHKNAKVREPIEATGAELRFLPAYSPDLNPMSRPSPNSRRTCARHRNDRSMPSGGASASCSISSNPPNAPTSSSIPVMLGPDRIPL